MALGDKESKLKVVISADSKKLNTAIGKSQTKLRGFADSIRRHQKAIGIAMLAMGAAIMAMGVKSVKAFADMGDEVQKMAKRTGFGTEMLSELRHAADLSGTSLASIDKAAKRMSKTIVDASEGMATYIRAFERIGLSAEELIALSPEEQFWKIAGAIGDLEDHALKAATAQDVFGRAGTELLPMLEAGTEGIAAMRKEAHELGIVFDQEAANKAAEFKDNLTRLTGSIKGTQIAIADNLLPILEPMIKSFTEVMKVTSEWTKQNKALSQSLMFLFGGIDQQYIQVLKSAQAVHAEHQKALKGEENQFKETLESHVKLVESYISMANLREEDIVIQEKWIQQAKELISQLEQHEVATNEYNDALERNEELLATVMDMHESMIERLREEREAQLELAAALKEVAESRRHAQLEAQATLMQQIQAGGGRISPERIQKYYELMEKPILPQLAPERFQAVGIVTKPTLGILGEAGPEAVVPLKELAPIVIHNYTELDGRIIAETVKEILGEDYSRRSHIGGKE